jgi:hypothetical protein
MDLGMTIDAGSDGSKMALAVTFETEGPNIGTDQKKSIGGSMRFVAAAASLNLHRHVFEDPWTSLLRMAFKTGIIIHRKFIPLSQTRSRPGPVRGMAVGALQFPFDDPMVGGKVELRLHV